MCASATNNDLKSLCVLGATSHMERFSEYASGVALSGGRAVKPCFSVVALGFDLICE